MITSQHRRSPSSLAATRLASFCVILLYSSLISTKTLASQYNPELQNDGIPVFSARSGPAAEASASSPLITNDAFTTNSVQWPDDDIPRLAKRPAQHPRRHDSVDLDEALEDNDDEDEVSRSGSINRESIENPSYGESRRAERDGEEIEDFFDRHLGPPPRASSKASADETQQVAQHVEVPALDPDDDGDEFETAASGPIASFLHNLIFHPHQSTSTSSSSSPSSSASASSLSSQDSASSTESSLLSNKNNNGYKNKRPFIIHAFGGGSSKSPTSDQSKADETPTSSIASAPQGSSPNIAPLAAALLAPMQAAPSTLVAYEPQSGGQESQTNGNLDNPVAPNVEDGGGASAGVREIYIGRRPTVLSYLEQQSAKAQQQQQQQLASSTSDEQQQYTQAPPGQQHQQQLGYYHHHHQHHPNTLAAGSAQVWRTPFQPQMISYQQQMPAASYGHRQQYPEASSSAEASQDEDDGQTVTYGLSFGSRPHHSAAASEEDSSGTGVGDPESAAMDSPTEHQMAMMRAQQQHYQQQVAADGYVPYSARYRHSPTAAAANNNNNNYPHQPTQRLTSGQQQYLLAQQYQRLHKMQRGGDDSDSMARAAANYAQAYPASTMNHGQQHFQDQQQQYSKRRQSTLDRQKLLAKLNKELRASIKIDSSATTPQRLIDQIPSDNIGRQPITKFRSIKRGFLGDDLNSYSAFHAEVDPYKSFTTSARMVPAGEANSAGESSNNDKAEAGFTSTSDRDLIGNPSGELRNNSNLLTGPLINFDENKQSSVGAGKTKYGDRQLKQHLRVRRDDTDEREDADDDGVWVDDDEDDDNRHQSSDLNETAQEPEGEEEETDDTQQDSAGNAPQTTSQLNSAGMIGGPHSYELAPNDLMIYNG